MALSAPSFASRDDAATSTGRRDLRPLRYLLRYVGRYRRQLALAAVALVVAAGTVLGLGQGLRLLVDRGFGGRDPALLDAALVVLLAVVLLLALASFLRFYMISWVGERVVVFSRRGGPAKCCRGCPPTPPWYRWSSAPRCRSPCAICCCWSAA